MKIWANTLVKNEERYIWFAVSSVISHVDKVLIWDTGSTDGTVEIIKELHKKYPTKIIYKEIGNVDAESYTQARQEMLEITRKEADWLLILDGDEAWWDNTIENVVNIINSEGKYLDSIVSEFRNVVRDIYHYQDETAGMYKIDGEKGHLTIRAFSMKVPGIHHSKPHGQHGLFDKDNVLIQDKDPNRRVHAGLGFLHFSNLIRSRELSEDKKVLKRSFKYKYDVGNTFPADYFYPEAFFRSKPSIVPSPWVVASDEYIIKASLQMPLKYIKRNLLPAKKGY